ncbi:hypothetical protein IEO21_01090 [Rhodonia placenta]|uniref:Uncharacterized protein n=2 Tax=Rhodonia placenta TaxID=104341 RepID=A0A1X6N6N2_9APHY|nr:hypothetical protein POSPLADRAFT_1138508 [Postia placenta MAD-698-R-SB12]KAF9820863.1 hypothetical protein IEO21_01090 [Postia placenta]OSX64142.1 hypothetical protein POSPLADRAFT_1138508 [Postia placenta MAD-698-R-SB12]
MTQHDLEILDTIGTPDYLKGELSDDDVDVPSHMVPPNPEDSDVLPSQVHPSYPYGNPLNIKHPAARPRRPYDPSSRALFEDMGYSGGGVNGSLRWKDLALDTLFPVDEAREEAEKAAQARKMASGATANHPPPQPPPIQAAQMVDDGEDEEENDENENDENDEDIDDENEGGSSAEEDDA